jgi:hypothetical protein
MKGDAMFLRPALAETHRTEAIPDNRKPSTRNKASYGPDTQIAELNAFILRSLHQIANHVHARRFEQAGKVCEIVTVKRTRLIALMAELQAADTLPEPAPVLVKPKNKAVRKPKRYPRWGDK